MHRKISDKKKKQIAEFGRIYSVREAAFYFRVAKSTVWKYLKDPKIKSR